MFTNLSCKTLDDYLVSLRNLDILLYGAGAFGGELCDVLKKHSILPVAFLDKNKTGTKLSVPIFHPKEYKNKDSLVVIAIVLNKSDRIELIKYLNSLGYNNILDGQIIRAHYVQFESGKTYCPNEASLPLAYLADEESVITYKTNVLAHLNRNYDNCVQTDEKFQYFVNIEGNNRFSNFVDCGAYIGDTYLEAKKAGVVIDNYYAFEPMLNNFEKLRENLKDINCYAYNYAVSDSKKTLCFQDMLGSSHSCENGGVLVSAINLDNILSDKKIDFIKMDIEGEELGALIGAQKIIKTQKPNLAICLYHYINHFWEIPNLIHSWNLGYKLYVRTHSGACMETVLYAIKEEK